VYSSADGQRWVRQEGNLLEMPGRGAEDEAPGQHADVVAVGDRAWLFYSRKLDAKQADSQATRRSSIQVVELQQKDGRLIADRNAQTRIALRAP
jgi:hypothetical protein